MQKHLFYPLPILVTGMMFLAVVSCGKKNEPAPDVAAASAGTYNVTYIREGSREVTLPQAGISATLKLTRETEKTVGIVFTLNEPNKAPNASSFGSITVERQSDNSIKMTESGQQLGTIKDQALNISGEDDSGTQIEIRATKQ